MTGTGLHCPRCGCVSTDPAFCSDCGAAMGAPLPAAAADDTCPSCGEPRPGKLARYCDNCRYDFLSRQPFAASQPAAPAPVAAAPPVAAGRPARRWDLRASVDLALRRPDDPEPPDTRERIFPLDLADHLIGRRSDNQDIRPEIVIADPGISRRHARVIKAADGTVSALDLGSMNGTRLNGTPMDPNVPMPLNEGDELTMGCWTRLKLEAR